MNDPDKQREINSKLLGLIKAMIPPDELRAHFIRRQKQVTAAFDVFVAFEAATDHSLFTGPDLSEEDITDLVFSEFPEAVIADAYHGMKYMDDQLRRVRQMMVRWLVRKGDRNNGEAPEALDSDS